MFKRVVWMGAGFGAGVGATVWANVKLRRTAQRFTPAAVGEELSHRVRSLRADVAEALADGRQAMKKREAELRAGHHLPALGDRAVDRAAIPAESRGRTSQDRSQTPAAQLGPALPWSDHGHEWASARLS